MSETPLALGVPTAVALVFAITAASMRGSPVPVGGIEFGDTASIVFFVALAIGFAFYAGGLLVLRRTGGRLATVYAIAAAIQLIPLGGPLLLSHDVYSYWAYARIASRHDSNPSTVRRSLPSRSEWTRRRRTRRRSRSSFEPSPQ